jgi:hypothetical protein
MASRSQIIRGVAPQVPGNAFPGAWIAIWILSSRQCCHVNGKGARLQIKSENQMNRGPQGGMTGADSELRQSILTQMNRECFGVEPMIRSKIFDGDEEG